MKKNGILNKDISEAIAGLGHLDLITLCDAGLPIPLQAKRIDLAVVPGIPSFIDVLTALANDLVIQEVILANELIASNPVFVQKITTIFPDVKVTSIDHEEFKVVSNKSKAFIRTGECTPYANVILVSGVPF
jgi:D-ribose pyranase